jgi:hypothetical protein
MAWTVPAARTAAATGTTSLRHNTTTDREQEERPSGAERARWRAGSRARTGQGKRRARQRSWPEPERAPETSTTGRLTANSMAGRTRRPGEGNTDAPWKESWSAQGRSAGRERAAQRNPRPAERKNPSAGASSRDGRRAGGS